MPYITPLTGMIVVYQYKYLRTLPDTPGIGRGNPDLNVT